MGSQLSVIRQKLAQQRLYQRKVFINKQFRVKSLSSFPTRGFPIDMSSSPFTETDQKELEAFLESENAKARIQQTVHSLTDRCWDKCISKVGNKLDHGQESCLSNCVDRFLDSSVYIVKRLEQLRSGGGMM
ncbi:hypothetical protein VTP01DRAFT_4637, partial [Rhizomucor pusillus]|uniref:uncharacterized protein n=1 Tax=Rhizomucor pusillus TaxID=4840 RepID=UPI003743BEF7